MAQEQSVRSKRDVQANQIRVIDQECVNKQNQVCANNGTSECYQCAIFAGDAENSIKYVASWKKDDIERVGNLSEEELIKPVEPPKEIEVDEDKSDIPHFVKCIQHYIIHTHSGSEHIHKHYFLNRLGDNCIFCGAPIVGDITCQCCISIYKGEPQSSNSLYFADDRSLVCDLVTKRILLM